MRRRVLAAIGCALALTACGGGGAAHRTPEGHTRTAPTAVTTGGLTTAAHPLGGTTAPRARATTHRGPFAIGLRVLHIVDHTRTIVLPDGRRIPRPITTIVRYPASGRPGGGDRPRAPAARGAGPFPLVVFGHGFAETPGAYAQLLRAWTAAGFVVAAPVFPLENANAPGGPDERDLENQPQDMRVVIDRLLNADARRGGWAAGLIDGRRLGVAGQSDGGETALALAYDRRFRDPRVRAAVLLAGAQLPVGGRASLLAHGPPLLAVQGSADTINPPARTAAFFAAVHAPKFLLTLIGASHLAPYTTEQPQLGVVERASTAFLQAYLGAGDQRASHLAALGRGARRPRVSTLLARP